MVKTKISKIQKNKIGFVNQKEIKNFLSIYWEYRILLKKYSVVSTYNLNTDFFKIENVVLYRIKNNNFYPYFKHIIYKVDIGKKINFCKESSRAFLEKLRPI